MPGPVDFKIGEILRLRKKHACGGSEWEVTRLGADIGIRCLTCRRYILLPRRDLELKLKQRKQEA